MADTKPQRKYTLKRRRKKKSKKVRHTLPDTAAPSNVEPVADASLDLYKLQKYISST